MKKPIHRNKPRKASQPPQQVRIIGGQWKRTLLPVAEGAGLRPTPDRVRETVFNWLNHLRGGEWAGACCLDLFAGSGSLGFEAASRGASGVVMVESQPQACAQLLATKDRLKAEQVRLVRGDAERMAQGLAQQGERFDLIFLDPPYRMNMLERMLPLCARLLAEGGIVYAESEEPLVPNEKKQAPEWMSAWEVVRADRAGNVFYHLLRSRAADIAA